MRENRKPAGYTSFELPAQIVRDLWAVLRNTDMTAEEFIAEAVAEKLKYKEHRFVHVSALLALWDEAAKYGGDAKKRREAMWKHFAVNLSEVVVKAAWNDKPELPIRIKERRLEESEEDLFGGIAELL